MMKVSVVAYACILGMVVLDICGCQAPKPNLSRDRGGEVQLTSIASPFYMGMSEADALSVDAIFEHADMLMSPADWSDVAYKTTHPDGSVIYIGFYKDRVIGCIEVVKSVRSVKGVHLGMTYAELLALYPDAEVAQGYTYATCGVYVEGVWVEFGFPQDYEDRDWTCEEMKEQAGTITASRFRI